MFCKQFNGLNRVQQAAAQHHGIMESTKPDSMSEFRFRLGASAFDPALYTRLIWELQPWI